MRRPKQKTKQFIFENNTKKIFIVMMPYDKSFLLLFCKKEALPS